MAWFPSCRAKTNPIRLTLELGSWGEWSVPKVNAPGRYAPVKGTALLVTEYKLEMFMEPVSLQ